MTSIMEAPAMLEDGNAPQSRRSMCLRVAFCALIFLLIISALVPLIFCLLHHQLHHQAPGSCWAHGYVNEPPTLDRGHLSWVWKFENCNGVLQDLGKYLKIQQSGNYFVYAQLYREKTQREAFTLTLYKDYQILLNLAVGHYNGTINFARPFFLQEGDKLYCKKNDDNDDMDNSEPRNQTYWGLIKM